MRRRRRPRLPGWLLVAGLATAVGVSGPAAPAGAAPDGTRPALTVSTAKDRYAVGEPVSLTFTVTNTAGAPCQLAALADGTVQVSALTRDGTPVPPSLTTTTYGQGYEAGLRASLHNTAPAGHVSFRVPLIADSVPASSPLPGGIAVTALWPVDRPGRYRLSAVYAIPSVDAGSPPLCTGASDVATVTFTVGSAGTGGVLRILLIAAGALALLGVVLWLVLRRRRRTPAAAVLLLLAVFAGAGLGARPAHADWAPDLTQGSDFVSAVNKCFAVFQGPNGDPAGILKDILDPKKPRVTITTQASGEGPQTTPTPNSKFGPGSSTIQWNKDSDFVHVDGGTIDPCTELYHELYHAMRNMNGTASNEWCDDTGIRTEEVEASFAENRYRAAHNLGKRTSYGKQKLPDSLDECRKKPKGRTASEPCQGYQGCGGSNGDPHLTTFDGRRYDFQAVGEFVAVRSGDDLEVQTRQSPAGSSRFVSVNTAVAVKDGTDRVGFTLADGTMTVTINGQPVTDERRTLSNGGSLTRRDPTGYLSADGYTVSWPDGSAAWVDPIGIWGLRLYVGLAPARRGHVSGLLGDFDGDGTDDPVNRTGTALPARPSRDDLYRSFGDSWRIGQSESLFEYGPGQSTQTYTDRTFPDRPLTVADLPAPAVAQARTVCAAAGVTDAALLDACLLDVAVTGQPAFAVNSGDTQAIAATPAGPDTGTATTLTLTTPGQPAELTFTGTAGQRVFVDLVASTAPDACGALLVRAPNGSLIGEACTQGGKAYVDGTVLPADGTYRVLVSFGTATSGTAQVLVTTSTDQQLEITPDGPPVTAVVDRPGMVSQLSFSATAGQVVFVDVPSTTLPTQCGVVTVVAENGHILNGGCVDKGTGYVDRTELPTTGRYRVVVDPGLRNTGQAEIRLRTATDQRVPVTVNGPPVTAVVGQPGALAVLSFTGSAGQSVSVTVTGSTMPDECGALEIRAPAGNVLAFGCITGGTGSIAPTVLPGAGQYQVVIDPRGYGTGHADVRVHS